MKLRIGHRVAAYVRCSLAIACCGQAVAFVTAMCESNRRQLCVYRENHCDIQLAWVRMGTHGCTFESGAQAHKWRAAKFVRCDLTVASPGYSARWGTACMFTKSGSNYRNFYTNITN